MDNIFVVKTIYNNLVKQHSTTPNSIIVLQETNGDIWNMNPEAINSLQFKPNHIEFKYSKDNIIKSNKFKLHEILNITLENTGK